MKTELVSGVKRAVKLNSDWLIHPFNRIMQILIENQYLSSNLFKRQKSRHSNHISELVPNLFSYWPPVSSANKTIFLKLCYRSFLHDFHLAIDFSCCYEVVTINLVFFTSLRPLIWIRKSVIILKAHWNIWHRHEKSPLSFDICWYWILYFLFNKVRRSR